MTTNLIKPSRIDFDKVDINQIQRILSTGTLEALAPDEREYYSLMEMVRGLRARMRINGKLVTKAGIIRLLKSEPYGLSDWMARQVYADSLNFFYTQDNVRPQAFANLYAEKAENWANTVFLMGNVKEAKNLLKLAAELRGCYKDQQAEIPEELLSQKSTVIYTTSRKDLGVPEIDRKELEEFIDAIPEIPVIVRENIKEDARIKAFDLKKRMLYDIKGVRGKITKVSNANADDVEIKYGHIIQVLTDWIDTTILVSIDGRGMAKSTVIQARRSAGVWKKCPAVRSLLLPIPTVTWKII